MYFAYPQRCTPNKFTEIYCVLCVSIRGICKLQASAFLACASCKLRIIHSIARGLKIKKKKMPFLGAFRKIAPTSFVMSVRPSIFPRGTTQHPLGGFSWT